MAVDNDLEEPLLTVTVEEDVEDRRRGVRVLSLGIHLVGNRTILIVRNDHTTDRDRKDGAADHI